jgi:hypothetical protein
MPPQQSRTKNLASVCYDLACIGDILFPSGMSYILLSLDIGNVSFILKEGSILKGSVVDRHRFDADPDPPNVHVDADQIRNGLSILIRILPQILHILDI